MSGWLVVPYVAIGAVVAAIAGPQQYDENGRENGYATQGGQVFGMALVWPLIVAGFLLWVLFSGLGRLFKRFES